MIVLDTNVLSELYKPAPAAEVVAWLAMHPSTTLFTTAVTQAEMLLGAELMPKGKRRAAIEATIRGMFEVSYVDRILPFDSNAARQFQHIVAYRRALGRPISVEDSMIAAIARSQGAVLATRDTGDFEHCGITVLNPWTTSAGKVRR
jgi:predicted nucleic acid-binding protein